MAAGEFAEAHERKEQHDVDVQRAAADGGVDVGRGDRVRVREGSPSPHAGRAGTVGRVDGKSAIINWDDGGFCRHAFGELEPAETVAFDGGQIPHECEVCGAGPFETEAGLRDHECEPVTDGGTDGAIDADWEDAERPPREQLEAEMSDLPRGLIEKGIALDLVTRQLLYVRERSYDDLVAHYEAEGRSLLSYGVHPLLPVTIDDAVFECVYLSDVTAENLLNFEDAKAYSFPRGRLAHVPVERSWLGGGDD